MALLVLGLGLPTQAQQGCGFPDADMVDATECAPQGGRLTVSASPRGRVYVNDVFVGRSPLSNHFLDAGRYEVKIKWNDGATSRPKVLNIREGTQQKLTFKRPKASPAQKRAAEAARNRHGWVRIYTTTEALVTVDGKPYPKRSEFGTKITANDQHEIKVKLGEKEKVYTVQVGPREMKTLLVDLAGYQSPASAAPSGGKPVSPLKTATNEKSEGDEAGKLTVYSKPKGEVYVDGSAIGATTPMINRELDLGRHEVQVKWESGVMSEVKTIRIRKGSKLKLFFRDRSKNKK